MYSRGKGRAASFVWGWFFVAIVGGLLLSGCGGGGGGVDVDDDGPYSGGGGTGAENAITFWRYYGTLDAGEVGENHAVARASDGGYVAAGWIAPDFIEENRNYIILKTNDQGLEQWRLQGNLPGAQMLHAIRETSDGGVIAVGYTGTGNARDVLAIKTTANGGLQWLKTFDAGMLESEQAHALVILADGYAIAGSGWHRFPVGGGFHQQEDMWFFRIDIDGNKIADSDRFITFPGWSRANSMERTQDGGFILAGGGPPNAIVLARLDENGDPVWERRDYGTGIAHAVRPLPAPDDGFVVVGSTTFFPEKASDLLVLRIDGEGNERWRRVFGGSELDIGYGVALTPEGDIVVAGVTESFSSGTQGWQREDCYLIKLAPDGRTLWQKVKGMRPQNSERPVAVEATPDGGFIVAGAASAINLLAKFDKNGDTVRLGEKDFTYTVPEVTGLIHIGNALEVARMAGDSLLVPFQVGSFVVDRLIDTLNGAKPEDFCSSGDFSWDSPITDPVAGGQAYEITFRDCTVGSGEEANTFVGTIEMTVALVEGDLKTDVYRISVTIDAIDVAISDSAGTGRISGGMAYDRTSAGGVFAERATVGEGLQLFDDGGPLTIRRIDATAERTAAGVLTITETVENGLIDPDLGIGSLTVSLVAPVVLDNEPSAGTLAVEAEDASNLIVNFFHGVVDIAVDTNGDGVIDGTNSMEWD